MQNLQQSTGLYVFLTKSKNKYLEENVFIRFTYIGEKPL